MKRNEEMRLNRLQMKLETEKQIVEAILNGSGEWHDGEGKGKLVLRVFAEDRLSATVIKDINHSYLPRYFIKVDGWKMKMGITDQDLTCVLDEGVKKVQEAKVQAKQKADAERQKKSKVSNMDVFNRVAAFLKKNGYSITTPKDENEKITMKVSDKNILHWANVKDFVTATFDGKHSCNFGEDWNCPSIFRTISFWTMKYYKLAYPSLRKLVDKVKALGEVDMNAKAPVAVMDELNRLKI